MEKKIKARLAVTPSIYKKLNPACSRKRGCTLRCGSVVRPNLGREVVVQPFSQISAVTVAREG